MKVKKVFNAVTAVISLVAFGYVCHEIGFQRGYNLGCGDDDDFEDDDFEDDDDFDFDDDDYKEDDETAEYTPEENGGAEEDANGDGNVETGSAEQGATPPVSGCMR